MTEQPPSAEALELVSRLRKLRYEPATAHVSWHELNLLDAGKAIDALIAQRVSAETERWQNRDRQRLEQINRLQETVQVFQSARDEQPAPEASFAADLAAAQESLGAEFEKVLHDNLDQLYVRSEPTAVVDYTERAREIVSDWQIQVSPEGWLDMEFDELRKLLATALSDVASERDAALLARLQEPDVQEEVIHALMTTGGWVSSFAGKLPLVSAALADAAIAKITEMLK